MNAVLSSTRMKDVLEHDKRNGENNDQGDIETQTPASGSSRSSLLLESNEESVDTEEEMRKRRRGMIFRDSLVVPTRAPGRPKPRKAQITATEEDMGMSGSEAESVSSNGSLSRSASPSEASESSDESGGETSASDINAQILDKRGDGILVPPGLGHETPAHTPSSTLPPNTNTAVSSSQTAHSKPPTKPKKKKETILRPAFKRYLISAPPPVLVIHLKRFQQLNTQSSSALSSIAEKLALGFSTSQSGGRGASYGGAFGGIGGGGFKKLEEFVSFPEWLDLSPFLSPKKEDLVSPKRTKSQLGNDGQTGHKDSASRRENAMDNNGRCMYRLYAVVVHIGNMVSFRQLVVSSPLIDGGQI
jgi:hypothetical protein